MLVLSVVCIVSLCLALVHPLQFDCLLVLVSNCFVVSDSFEIASLALIFTEYVACYAVGCAVAT
jgi:hypothetical protein